MRTSPDSTRRNPRSRTDGPPLRGVPSKSERLFAHWPSFILVVAKNALKVLIDDLHTRLGSTHRPSHGLSISLNFSSEPLPSIRRHQEDASMRTRSGMAGNALLK